MHACRLVAALVLGQVRVVYALESSSSKFLELNSRVVGVVLCMAPIHMGWPCPDEQVADGIVVQVLRIIAQRAAWRRALRGMSLYISSLVLLHVFFANSGESPFYGYTPRTWLGIFGPKTLFWTVL